MGLLDTIQGYASDFYAGGQGARRVAKGLLTGDMKPVKEIGNELGLLFNPEYMANVKGMSMDDAMSIGMDVNPTLALMIKAKEPFNFIRNLEPSPKHIKGTHDVFGQRVEPAGRYMIEDVTNGKAPDGWEKGRHIFNNPKFINWGDGLYRDSDNWKNVLSKEYGGKTGKALSRALARDGYDGIVTLKDGLTSEVVDLSMFSKTGKSK